MSYAQQPIEPIAWSNLLRWARRTVTSDRKTYKGSERTPSLSRAVSLVSPNLKKPLFLIGSPRSGTTFLGNCLASLPEFSYHFEPIATKASARYCYNQLWSEQKLAWFYRNVYAWLMRIHANGDLRFAEKTPRNCFIIPFLAQTFPEAQFIHIIRDGRDVALSLSKKPWFLAAQANSGRYEPGGYPYGPYSQFWVEEDRRQEFEETSDIHRCIWVWKRFTEDALSAASTLPSERYCEVRYESIGETPQLCAEQLLDFMRIDNPSSRAAFTQALNTVDPNLSGQWRTGLTDEDLSVVEQEAGSLLSALSYQ